MFTFSFIYPDTNLQDAARYNFYTHTKHGLTTQVRAHTSIQHTSVNALMHWEPHTFVNKRTSQSSKLSLLSYFKEYLSYDFFFSNTATSTSSLEVRFPSCSQIISWWDKPYLCYKSLRAGQQQISFIGLFLQTCKSFICIFLAGIFNRD